METTIWFKNSEPVLIGELRYCTDLEKQRFHLIFRKKSFFFFPSWKRNIPGSIGRNAYKKSTFFSSSGRLFACGHFRMYHKNISLLFIVNFERALYSGSQVFAGPALQCFGYEH